MMSLNQSTKRVVNIAGKVVRYQFLSENSSSNLDYIAGLLLYTFPKVYTRTNTLSHIHAHKRYSTSI